MGYIGGKTHPEILVLFDVDGTLTPARKVITPEVKTLLERARKVFTVGFVGGSDLKKQKEQLGENCLDMFDYSFTENGIKAYKNGVLVHSKSILTYLGEEQYEFLCNDILKKLSEIKLPFKRGTFIELRTGLLNIAPPGRSCSPEERDKFEEYDKVHQVRKNLVLNLRETLNKYKLGCSLGGQISIDIFPMGWDKTYCLRHLKDDNYEKIHFFGNMYLEGGNDYEIINHPSIVGHRVDNPDGTVAQLNGHAGAHLFWGCNASCSFPMITYVQ